MASGQDWSQIIHQSEGERFVGREQELALFLEELRREPPRTLIFYLTGQAGVGKTTLLRRFQALARELGFLVAECDERQRDVLAVLGHLAAQFDQRGLRLKAFEDRHRLYYQRLHEIESDPQAPHGQGACRCERSCAWPLWPASCCRWLGRLSPISRWRRLRSWPVSGGAICCASWAIARKSSCCVSRRRF